MIVIPACGEGARFKEAGYEGPKHMLELGGKPMIEWVLQNALQLDDGPARVALQRHDSEPYYPITEYVAVGKTSGAIETVLKALVGWSAYNGKDPLLIANCDQLILLEGEWADGTEDGVVFTFRSNNPAHSYVTTTHAGLIQDIVEKPETPPSDRAVSGVYWFARADSFIESCWRVHKGMTGEQYLSAAIKDMLDRGATLHSVNAPTAILGTPEDFQRFQVALSCAA